MPYTELYHHGILGQKWGVRRYQYKDGTLTAAGKKRYSKAVVDKFDRMQIDTIKKGTTINRVANAGETLDSKRKYVSITPRDKRAYIRFALDGLLGNGSEDFGSYEYEAKKDLKVASGKEVTDYVIDVYGNELANRMYRTLKSAGYLDEHVDLDRTKKAGEELYNMRSKFREGLHYLLTQNMSEISDTYLEKGYDAIVDIEDWLGNDDLPLIILDPKDSMRFKKYNAIM